MEEENYQVLVKYLTELVVPSEYNKLQCRKLRAQARYFLVREGILYRRTKEELLKPLRVVQRNEVRIVLDAIHGNAIDQGSHFNNRIIADICASLSIKHRMSSSYHPQMNSQVERFNRTLCGILAKNEFVQLSLFAYRTARHGTTKYEPFFLTYGREARLPVESEVETYPTEPANEEGEQLAIVARIVTLIDNLKEARAITLENIKRSQRKQILDYNSRHSLHSFSIGDKVWRYQAKLDSRKGGKLEPRWLGPY
ncbi:7862_t:CDS:2 [Scutellospora calospora]|uniref:7862_t:CDS:1 n=1 Tax=Scutellospora calospora TaxID=85575 RepID=A0ACA9K0R3_9GLOM|nr:7862_t:CDS:2 [Scutellospora calospora]